MSPDEPGVDMVSIPSGSALLWFKLHEAHNCLVDSPVYFIFVARRSMVWSWRLRILGLEAKLIGFGLGGTIDLRFSIYIFVVS